MDNQKLLNNPLLIKWFSINVNLLNHPKLVCLPLGLPKTIPQLINDKNETFVGWDVCANPNYITYYLDNNFQDFSIIQNIIRKDKKLLFFRMTVKNTDDGDINHEYFNIRSKAMKYLNENKLINDEMKQELIDWRIYMKELKEYKFCLSLPGKGLDCYRTWEALTVGVIPIVLNTELSVLYNDLPIIVINNINEISEVFLTKKFQEIKNNICFYNFEKLKSIYWINIIEKNKIFI
jgi:hypothetical protein